MLEEETKKILEKMELLEKLVMENTPIFPIEYLVKADPNLALFKDDKYRAGAHNQKVWSRAAVRITAIVAGSITGLTTFFKILMEIGGI